MLPHRVNAGHRCDHCQDYMHQDRLPASLACSVMIDQTCSPFQSGLFIGQHRAGEYLAKSARTTSLSVSKNRVHHDAIALWIPRWRTPCLSKLSTYLLVVPADCCHHVVPRNTEETVAHRTALIASDHLLHMLRDATQFTSGEA